MNGNIIYLSLVLYARHIKTQYKNIIHPSEGYRDFPEQTRKIIFILMTYKISATGLLFLTLFSLNKLKMDSHIIIY